VEKSGSRTSLSRFAHTSTSTSRKYKDKDKDEDVHDKDNGQTTRVDDARVGMDLETLVAGQSVEKSGSKSHQKEISRSASGTSTRTTMGSNGHLTRSMDNDGIEAPVAGQLMEKSTSGAWLSVKNQGGHPYQRKHQDQHQVLVD
jgi:hypothetical protein